MLVYWLMFLIPAIAAMQLADIKEEKFNALWLFCIVLFIFFIGFRDTVGGDWFSYIINLERVKLLSFWDALTYKDPGYYGLNWVISRFDGTVHYVNLICAAIIMYGLAIFAKQQPFPWVALMVSVPYFLVVVAMGYTRQSVALGLVLIALTRLGQGSTVKFVVWVLIGALFHKSALLMLPIAALSTTQNKILTALWVGVTGLLAANSLLFESADDLWENYVVAQYSSQGGLIRVIMNVVPATIFLVFRDKLHLSRNERSLWFWMSCFAIVCLPLVVVSSTAVDRVALYFIPIQLFVFARLPYLAKAFEDVKLILLGVTSYYALVLFVWLNFASHAFAWVPYGNYFFMPDTMQYGPSMQQPIKDFDHRKRLRH